MASFWSPTSASFGWIDASFVYMFVLLMRSLLTRDRCIGTRTHHVLIYACRWSPDGGTLAVGSEDAFVYLYNCGDYIAKAKCAGHKGPVRARTDTFCGYSPAPFLFLQAFNRKAPHPVSGMHPAVGNNSDGGVPGVFHVDSRRGICLLAETKSRRGGGNRPTAFSSVTLSSKLIC